MKRLLVAIVLSILVSGMVYAEHETQIIDDDPVMDSTKCAVTICWDHTFNHPGATIKDANLTLAVFDVDAGEDDYVYVDGVKAGILDGCDNQVAETELSIDPSLLNDGTAHVCLEIEAGYCVAVYSSRLDVEYEYPQAPEFGCLAVAVAILVSAPAFAYLYAKKR